MHNKQFLIMSLLIFSTSILYSMTDWTEEKYLPGQAPMHRFPTHDTVRNAPQRYKKVQLEREEIEDGCTYACEIDALNMIGDDNVKVKRMYYYNERGQIIKYRWKPIEDEEPAAAQKPTPALAQTDYTTVKNCFAILCGFGLGYLILKQLLNNRTESSNG